MKNNSRKARLHTLNQRMHNGRRRLFARDSMVHNAHTPFELLYDDGLATLRHYQLDDTDSSMSPYEIPLLIIPPLAVSSKIFDFLENRSFVQFMVARGFRVYLIDWGAPTRKDTERGFDYYIMEAIPNMIRAVREHSGSEQVSLCGWSLGGFFTLIHAAYSQDPHIKNMFLIGVPINSYASGFLGKVTAMLGKTMTQIESKTGYHPRQLPDKMTHVPGWVNMMLFKVADPVGMSRSYWHLFKNLDNLDVLAENAAKADFINNMFDYPGAIIKSLALDILLSNTIIAGEFKLADKTIDLADISSNLFVISGCTDTLATTDAVHAIKDHVSSSDITCVEIPGGHVGIVASQITSERTWPVMVEWLAARSSADSKVD